MRAEIAKCLNEHFSTEAQDKQAYISMITDQLMEIIHDHDIPLIADAVVKAIIAVSDNKGVRDETIIAKEESNTSPQSSMSGIPDRGTRYEGRPQ